MQFDAPKLPTRGAANDPKLTGGAALAAKATPGTTAPKVEKKPPASKLPALEKKPTAPALPAGSSKPEPAPPLPPPPPAIEQEPVRSEPELSAPAYSNAPEARTSKTISYDGDWPEGDPATPWHAADWDIMFVLPLPEEAFQPSSSVLHASPTPPSLSTPLATLPNMATKPSMVTRWVLASSQCPTALNQW